MNLVTGFMFNSRDKIYRDKYLENTLKKWLHMLCDTIMSVTKRSDALHKVLFDNIHILYGFNESSQCMAYC